MTAVPIEHPVINSPYHEPVRHFATSRDGEISGEIEPRRRLSEFFVPVAKPRKASPQLAIQFGAGVRQQPNEIVNEIRQSVARWRVQGYPHTTALTRELLAHWQAEDRTRRLFFCQIEAAETAIFLTEAAEKIGDSKALNTIRAENGRLNDGLPRMAFKMATGSGKTVVMGMLIAWQALNKFANPFDKRFSSRFLIVTPGITIRDRLRVLLPNDPQTFFLAMDLVNPEQLDRLQGATIEITNYHALIRRDKIEAASLTKRILSQGDTDSERFKETPGEMVRRVCRVFGTAKDVVVLNDEAHHCYTPAPRDAAQEGTLDADERSEARRNEEEARVWFDGLRAVRDKIGIRSVFDVSATPFFLKGSSYAEGTLFPWVVSDFGLMDAIESGIVKIPRVPVADDSMVGELPRYRDLWTNVRDALPRKGLRDTTVGEGDPILPKVLEGALESLYADYDRSYGEWQGAGMGRPPVFIVVCSNTSVSKLVYDWIAGYDKPQRNGTTISAPGHLPLFSNVADGAWRQRPVSLLIDSMQLDRGDALDPAFKKAAAREIEEYRREYVTRFPGRSADEIEDEDILREVLNTVGKPGRLGAEIRCVVSVSMLTEGWDANTVTHILGIRAFGTQLLCEQVVGRALRRANYDPTPEGMFEPEYAEVLGVPFTFLSTTEAGTPRKPKPILTVRALPERANLRIEFPRVVSYRFEMPSERLTATFDPSSILELSTREVPTETQLDPIVGEMNLLHLPLREQRLNTVVFAVAKRTLDTFFRDEDGGERPWLFPQLASITRRWIDECVVPYLGDGAYPQLLLLAEWSHAAAERIHRAIARGTYGEPRLSPTLRMYDPIGSTDDVVFETTKTCFATTKSHINAVAQDSNWESELAQKLESMPEVVSYAKNQGLNLKIPYTFEGRAANYVPDFLIRLRDADSTGPDDLLTLLLEVSGEAKKEKQAKVAAARDLWVPAVNHWGGLGRWAFLEVTHMENAADLIRETFLVRASTSAGAP
ncbi:MAG: DEAD/DEAH box helicase family protein [Chloroflexi bacterium]|nr:DEAD/DEAH box helicase family protein [Chloroflexota bacterium]